MTADLKHSSPGSLKVICYLFKRRLKWKHIFVVNPGLFKLAVNLSVVAQYLVEVTKCLLEYCAIRAT